MPKKTEPEKELRSPPEKEVVWKIWVRGEEARSVEVTSRLFFPARAEASMLLGVDPQSLDGAVLEGVEPKKPKKVARRTRKPSRSSGG